MWYDSDDGDGAIEPGEVRMVGKSYAKWLVDLGAARILTEEQAVKHSRYVGQQVMGKWKQDEKWVRLTRSIAAIARACK